MSVNVGMMIEWRIHKTLQSSLTDVETGKVRSEHIEKLYKRQLFSGMSFSSLILKSHLKIKSKYDKIINVINKIKEKISLRLVTFS